jgi:hypothetical protein
MDKRTFVECPFVPEKVISSNLISKEIKEVPLPIELHICQKYHIFT